MTVQLKDSDLDPWYIIGNFQHHMQNQQGKFGATSVFVGTMRDMNENSVVRSMFLEHYPAMTQQSLEKIERQAHQQWNLIDTLIVHRFGEIEPNDTIVIVAVWSEHRDEAFKACRYLIEEIKHTAPFWKKELLSNTNESRWVTKNTS